MLSRLAPLNPRGVDETVSGNMRRSARKQLLVKVTVVGFLIYLALYVCRRDAADCSDTSIRDDDDDDVEDNSDTGTIDREWLSRRRHLLALNGENSSVASKALIVSYIRGGSSLFGELFNRHYADALWYEPLDAFYVARYGFNLHSLPLSLVMLANTSYGHKQRKFSPGEKHKMSEYLYRLLTCDMSPLPIETFLHPFVYQSKFFRPVYHCMQRVDGVTALIRCLRPIASDCGSALEHRRSWTQAEKARCHDVIAWFRAFKPPRVNKATEVGLRQAVLGYSDEGANRTRRMFDHYRCVSELESSPARFCVDLAAKMCSTTSPGRPRLIAVEVVRAALADLEPLIRRTPDIRVVYYVRDPRAIAVSRAVNVRLTLSAEHPADPVLEAQALCTRMRADLRARRRFDIVYPGAVFTIRYEDLVNNLNTTVAAVFRAVGRSVPIGTERWLESTMFGKVDHDAFSIQRSNATTTASKWMQQINYEQAIAMNKHCRSVLIQLGYQL